MAGIKVTYCSDIFKEVFSVTAFSSFEEFEQQFNHFKKKTGSVYQIKTSCSVEAENKLRESPLPA